MQNAVSVNLLSISLHLQTMLKSVKYLKLMQDLHLFLAMFFFIGIAIAFDFAEQKC